MQENYLELTRHSYDATAVEYQQNTDKLQPKAEVQNFLSYLVPNSRVLDLGCGPGRDAAFFVEHGHRIVGVDISPQMILIAQKKVPQGEFITSDIESLDLPAESYDAVWASASLLHVAKKAMPDILLMLYQTLKPGGIFYVSMKKGCGERIEEDSRYGGVKKFWNYVDEAELVNLLQRQGFTILEQDTHEKSTLYQTHPIIFVISQKTLR